MMVSVAESSLLLVLFFQFACSKFELDNAFAKIRTHPRFVDKTPLICEFLKHKYLFINAPSRFGKSTNLDMISLFLSNHRSKQTIENYFIWTEIWKNEDFVKNNLGKYPVINFSLKIRGFSSSIENTVTAFKVSLYNAFIDHLYLLESEKLSKEKIKLLEGFSDLSRMKLLDIDMVAKGLTILSETLYLHHNTPVILLADEFGRGISEGILTGHNDLSSMIELYSSIVNNMFYNESIISHALLSGESWLYGLKGSAVSLFERVPFMQKVEFSRFYGFTYNEVERFSVKFNVSNDERSEVLHWYGGYSTHDGSLKVCNPYSILQYFSLKRREVYWTGSPLALDTIRTMVEVDTLKQLIVNMVIKNSVDINIEKDTMIGEVEFLSKKIKELPQSCENYFLQILLELGYLTFSENYGQSNHKILKIPNEEVHSLFVKYTV